MQGWAIVSKKKVQPLELTTTLESKRYGIGNHRGNLIDIEAGEIRAVNDEI